jgi:hypothetical protein
MTIHDPRARQALYMAKPGRAGRGVPRHAWRVMYLIVPILIALAILWAFVF